MKRHNKIFRIGRSMLMVSISVVVIAAAFQLAGAGSLDPSASPAGTMNTLSQAYGAIASASFDSSAITGDKNGSALEISRCIINKLAGSPCP